MQPTLSVIIPAYNVEHYLDDCLESVVKQNNGKLEIVLVDDGSKDSTWDICCRYAEKYDYISAFTKPNEGQSSARNLGLEKATGHYVFFMDSDDSLTDGAIEKLFKKIEDEQNEVVIFLYKRLEDATGEISDCGYQLDEAQVENLTGEALLQYLITGRVYDWYPWLLVVRRSYLLERNLFFQKGVTFEDARWTPAVILHAAKVSYLDFPVYIYRSNRVGSTTSTFSEKNFISKIGVLSFIEAFSEENHFSKETKEKLFANVANLYVSTLFDVWFLEKSKRKQYLESLKKYKFILAESARTYHHLLYKLWSIVGITPVSYLLYLRALWVQKKK